MNEIVDINTYIYLECLLDFILNRKLIAIKEHWLNSFIVTGRALMEAIIILRTSTKGKFPTVIGMYNQSIQ